MESEESDEEEKQHVRNTCQIVSDDDIESATEESHLPCVCNGRYTQEEKIQCDMCSEWFHQSCIGLTAK